MNFPTCNPVVAVLLLPPIAVGAWYLLSMALRRLRERTILLEHFGLWQGSLPASLERLWQAAGESPQLVIPWKLRRASPALSIWWPATTARVIEFDPNGHGGPPAKAWHKQDELLDQIRQLEAAIIVDRAILKLKIGNAALMGNIEAMYVRREAENLAKERLGTPRTDLAELGRLRAARRAHWIRIAEISTGDADTDTAIRNCVAQVRDNFRQLKSMGAFRGDLEVHSGIAQPVPACRERCELERGVAGALEEVALRWNGLLRALPRRVANLIGGPLVPGGRMLLLSPYHRRRLASAVATEAARSGVNNLQEAERSILLALELAQANLARGLEDVSFVFPNHTTASAFDINSRMFAFEHSLHIRKAQREALLRVSQLLFL